MTDLISREAAIAWHIDRRDEAKANADRCRATDEETACRYLEEAILHSEAINALRALPAQAPAVKVKPLVWCQYGDGGVYTRAASTGRQYAVFQSAERPGEYAAHPLGSRAYSYFPTLEDAKAAMQADHAARILAAIEPAQGSEA